MLENGELVAIKANKFVQEYKVSLTLAEIRIVNYLIANIHSPKYDKEFRKFRLDINEFCKIVYPDKKIGDVYKWLPRVLENLAHKGAWKEVPSQENPGKMKKALIHWVERPEFEEGYVTVELNPNLAPYLLQLDTSFFRSKFKYTALAQSKYTIPLYELLKSWEKVRDHKKVFEIDELRAYMDAVKKSQNNVAEFKRTALEPAVKEINDITDLQISYTEIKRGRKVTHIEFLILHKPQEKEQEPEQLPGQMGIYDYPDVVPDEDRNNKTAENLYVQRVNDEAFNGEFTVEKAAYLIEIGKVRAQERVSEENLFDVETANTEKISYYREKYLQMKSGSTSKTVAGRAKYLEKILIAERDAGDELPAQANHKKSKDKFNNFHQREYNVGELEQQLLNSQK